MTRPDSYSLPGPPTALSTALRPRLSSDPASGRGDSNPGPPPPKGTDAPVRSVPSGPAASREGDHVGGLTSIPAYGRRGTTDTSARQNRRHSGPHVLAFYDGLCDPDELAAWDAFVAQRGGR